jgi:hypothetical protein
MGHLRPISPDHRRSEHRQVATAQDGHRAQPHSARTGGGQTTPKTVAVILYPNVRRRRQARLQRAEAAFDPLPFDGDAARAVGTTM